MNEWHKIHGAVKELTSPNPIYLDYNATTPVDPDVLDSMLPYLRERFGNPSSNSTYGRDAKKAVEEARGEVARLVGASSDEIVFTSGGSEGDNHAILGAAFANAKKGKHVITSAIEHSAVTETCQYLEEKFSFRVSYLPVDGHGAVSAEEVKGAITDDTVLISIMHANNEVGTVEPIEEIGQVARSRGILFHTDAAQSCGKIPVDVERLKVDLLTLAGHKIYAPKGIGALYVRDGVSIDSVIHGGSQEGGRRAGTENVPYIVGLGAACRIARTSLPRFSVDAASLRDRLYEIILGGLDGRVKLNGHREKRVPNTLNISIGGIIGGELLARVPEIAASTGSACHSGSPEPSGVLLAMGLSHEEALGAIRLSLGRWTTREEIETAANLIVKGVLNLPTVLQNA